MPRTRYSPDQREEALDLYREHGAAEAARLTGINAATLRSWASRSGVATAATQQTAAAVTAARLTFEERRARLAEALLDDADRLRGQMWQRTKITYRSRDGEVVTEELDEPPPADKQRLMTAAAIAADKAQLLHGDPTSRFESVAPIDPRRLRDELADRRARHQG